jgi:hypothetical protein
MRWDSLFVFLIVMEYRTLALISFASCATPSRFHRTETILNLRGGSAFANLYRSAASEQIEAIETHGLLRKLAREDKNLHYDSDSKEEEELDEDPEEKDDEKSADPDSGSQISRAGGQSSVMESEQFPAGSGGKLMTKDELKAQNLIDSESSMAGSELGDPENVKSDSDIDNEMAKRFRDACQKRIEASRRFLIERVNLSPKRPFIPANANTCFTA